MDSKSRYWIVSLLMMLFMLPTAESASLTQVKMQSRYGVTPGGNIDLSLLMQSPQQLGGIDFTIKYDDTIFQFVSVAQDTGLRHWEFFQSSHNVVLRTVRVVAIADIVNGPIHPDSADFHPKGSIASFRFSVLSNWTADSSRIPFTFYWGDCGDNAVSNRLGDTLIVVRQIFDSQGQLFWDETDNGNFPEGNRIPNIGLPDSCLQGVSGLAFRLNFQFGAVANYVICGNADADGNVNISDVAYLIAYIFNGGGAPQPLAAGDVDCSGAVNVSDAVYLINYIFAGGPEPCHCP